MPTKNTPPAKAEGAEPFWDKPTETPVADPNAPIAGVATTTPVVRVEGAPPLPDPACASIPDVVLEAASAADEAPVDDGRKTPAEWAAELGHVDAPAIVSTDPKAKFDTDSRGRPVAKKIRPIRQAKGWIFAATKRHAGWGTAHPDDVRLTRDEYEAAVKEALGTSVAPARAIPTPPSDARLKSNQPAYPEDARPKAQEWRADVRKTPAEIEELRSIEEATAKTKGGG